MTVFLSLCPKVSSIALAKASEKLVNWGLPPEEARMLKHVSARNTAIITCSQRERWSQASEGLLSTQLSGCNQSSTYIKHDVVLDSRPGELDQEHIDADTGNQAEEPERLESAKEESKSHAILQPIYIAHSLVSCSNVVQPGVGASLGCSSSHPANKYEVK